MKETNTIIIGVLILIAVAIGFVFAKDWMMENEDQNKPAVEGSGDIELGY